MVPPLAYLSVVPFAAKVMGRLDRMSLWFGFIMVFVVLRTQLWFQRMDLEADAEVGKHTTAVYLGSKLAAVGVFVFLAAELVSEQLWGCQALQAWSCFSAAVFALELVLQRKVVTKALMALSGLVFLVPVMHCLQAHADLF